MSRIKKYLQILLLALLIPIWSFGQNDFRIRGKVTSAEDKQPLPGVTVVVKNTTIGTTTDIDGNFSLSVSSEADALVFSFIGMESKEVPIDGKTTINVELTSASEDIEEVVVVAFGTQKKTEMVGSVSSIKPAELRIPEVI